MRPALEPGGLAWWTPRSPGGPPPAPGAVVLVRHPYRRDLRLVKRLAGFDMEGRLSLRGDVPAGSTDSRHFGSVAAGLLLGTVHLPPR